MAGSRPSRIRRRLVLDDQALTDIGTEMRAVFGHVRQERLQQFELFIARR